MPKGRSDIRRFTQRGIPITIFWCVLHEDVFDDFIPGIPRPEGGTDNITGEIHTVVRAPKAGLYTFGFNSDDGFKTIAGNDAADSVYLGGFNGGRAASTTSFRVLFPKARDYPLRSIWYQGGGVANLEWLTITPNKALLNDCLLYTSPSPRDLSTSRMPSYA